MLQRCFRDTTKHQSPAIGYAPRSDMTGSYQGTSHRPRTRMRSSMATHPACGGPFGAAPPLWWPGSNLGKQQRLPYAHRPPALTLLVAEAFIVATRQSEKGDTFGAAEAPDAGAAETDVGRSSDMAALTLAPHHASTGRPLWRCCEPTTGGITTGGP